MNGVGSDGLRQAYECYLGNWVLPRRGGHRLEQIKLVAIDEWLDRIERVERTHQARAPKREEGRTPDVLELEELQHLLSKLGPRERMLVLLDAATGLRVSELLEHF